MDFPAQQLPVRVYLAPGGDPAVPAGWVWQPITGDVRVSSGITVEMGADDEAAAADPGKASVTIDNTGGHYTTRNPLGRHYPKLRRNTPIRIALAPLADTFNRTVAAGWGTASDGPAWVGYTAVGGDIHNGVTGLSVTPAAGGRIEVPTGAVYNRRVSMGGAKLLDADVTVDVRYPALAVGANAYAGPLLRFGPHPKGGTTWYLVAADFTTAGTVSLVIYFARNNGVNLLPTTFAGIPHDPAAYYRIRALIEGDRIYGKVWKVGDPEPATWHVLYHHADGTATLIPGEVGFRASINPGNTNPDRVFYVRNLAVESNLFVGTVPAWPPRWDRSGRNATVPITAAGVLRRIAQGKAPLRSPLVRQMLANAPTQYIPLQDGDDATTLAASEVSGAEPATLYGVTMGQDDTLPGATTVATMATGSLITTKIPPHNAPDGWTFVCFFRLAALPPSEFELLRLLVAGGTAKVWTVVMETGGGISIRGLDDDGAIIYKGGITFNATGVDPRRWNALQIKLTRPTGTTVNVDIYAYPLVSPNVTTFYGAGLVEGSDPYTGTPGTVSTIRVTGATGWLNGNIGHLFYSVTRDVEFVAYDFLRSAWGYLGELAGARIRRLCSEEGMPVTIVPGDSEALGQQKEATFVELLQEAERTDLGRLYELGAGLAYVTRGARYNAAPGMELDFRMFDGDGDVGEEPEPTDDDQQVRNDITVNRVGGSSARAVDLDHIAAEGRYDEAFTVSLPTDNRLTAHANWRLRLLTTDELRWPRIVINLAARPELIFPVLCLRPGTRITLDNPPMEVIGPAVDLIVDGYTFDIGPFAFTATLTCSPAGPWQVGTIGAGRVDSTTTTLATALDAAGTDLRLATPGQWTTRPASYPFDLVIAGERVRALGPGNVRIAHQFTTDAEDWTVEPGGGAAARSTVVAKRGPASLMITPAGGVAYARAYGPTVADATTVGTTYAAGMWVYATEDVTDLRLIVEYFAGATYVTGHGYDGDPFTLPAATWTYVQKTFSATPATTTRARLQVRLGGTPPASNKIYVSHPMLFDPAAIATTSPYRMTGARGLNDVTRPLPAGSPVRLWRAARVAL
ncbi:hypothetical protein GCM10010112_87220 [Actinoplanes lobatus]|uniref:Uncharacterized protein n=1 Tax=Actinoplanes lobatus TaxID=113568 RepID=A0A7W7HC10_9ACTN|nr:hypothetical protein [Actinoplanes lobatus]MBB4747743.1 hypothetical protein [Actinoplanes lobatus]GGN96196.1 hypothetical protein GCM10010112_87220 [Actinoplanes lobatus]GIE45186.1 hypothetical protein Alo02nite_80840 [Actinoplanes lobatus]